MASELILYRDLYENAPCGYLILDLDGAITSANRTFLDIIKLPKAEGLRFRSLLTVAGALYFDTQVLPALLLGGNRGEVALDLRAGKERLPVLAYFSVVRDENGNSGIRAALFSAKERRLFEKDLVRSRREAEQLSEVILHSSDAIITVLVDGTVRNWNTGACEMFGYSSAEAAGKQLSDLIPLEGPHLTFVDAIAALGRGKESSWETVSRDKNGSPLEISIKLTPHMEAPGTLVAYSAIVRDISKLKVAERALLQSEKLASVGRLASSISHEINNPLAAVTNLLYLIHAQAETLEMKELAQTAQDELSRVSQITSHTLRFHRQTSNPTQVDMHSLLESVAILFRARLRNSQIETAIEHCDLSLFCHEGEIRQVLLNIVGNSIDAMKFGGRLRFRCRAIRDWRTDSIGIRITIADTGTGMHSETLARMCEPFFTTKGIGGTGLGLWVTQDLVIKNGGSMRVRSSTSDSHRGTVSVLFFGQVDQALVEP